MFCANVHWPTSNFIRTNPNAENQLFAQSVFYCIANRAATQASGPSSKVAKQGLKHVKPDMT